MARRSSSSAVMEHENDESVAPEEVTETTEATETPVAPEGEVEFDFTEFNAAVEAATATRDSATGDLPEASISTVQAAYRNLDGLKAKNAAKKMLQDAVRSAMKARDLSLARASMLLMDSLAGSAVRKTAAEKAPTDPTEAYVARLAAIAIADTLVREDQPEGLGEDWEARLAEAIDGASGDAKAYAEWANTPTDARGDEPEVSPLARSAVRLAQGRSTRTARSSSPRAVYSGPKREIGRHIAEAFADKEPGTFMSVADLRAFRSEEYGNDHPSPGALLARLFPRSGRCTLDVGVKPATSESGKKGAVKL